MAKDSLNWNTILIIGGVAVGGYFLYKAFKGGAGEVFVGGSDVLSGIGTAAGGILGEAGPLLTSAGDVIVSAGNLAEIPVKAAALGLKEVSHTLRTYGTIATSPKSLTLEQLRGTPTKLLGLPVLSPLSPFGLASLGSFNIDLISPIIKMKESIIASGRQNEPLSYSNIDQFIFGGLLPGGYVKSSMSSYQATAAAPQTTKATPTPAATTSASSTTKTAVSSSGGVSTKTPVITYTGAGSKTALMQQLGVKPLPSYMKF